MPADVSLIDFGTSGFKTALEIGSYDKVVFIDAVKAGNKPGHVYKFVLSQEDLRNSPSLASFAISLHESDLERILATAVLLNSYPKEVVVIGCEPKDISFSLNLSREVKQAMSKIIELTISEIGQAHPTSNDNIEGGRGEPDQNNAAA